MATLRPPSGCSRPRAGAGVGKKKIEIQGIAQAALKPWRKGWKRIGFVDFQYRPYGSRVGALRTSQLAGNCLPVFGNKFPFSIHEAFLPLSRDMAPAMLRHISMKIASTTASFRPNRGAGREAVRPQAPRSLAGHAPAYAQLCSINPSFFSQFLCST